MARKASSVKVGTVKVGAAKAMSMLAVWMDPVRAATATPTIRAASTGGNALTNRITTKKAMTAALTIRERCRPP